jgi:hypothetical protein
MNKKHLEALWAQFSAAQEMQDPMGQITALNRLMEGMVQGTAASLVASLKFEDLKGTAAQLLFDHWASANPASAANWAQAQSDPEIRQSFLTVAALRWAVTDLPAAASWGRSLPDGDLRNEIMVSIGSEAVRSNPIEALKLAAELPSSTMQADLVCRAAAEWAVTDRDSVLEWSKQIKDVNLLQRVTEQIVLSLADENPSGAAINALVDMNQGLEQDRVIVSIVQRWVQTDPEKASEWVSQFPEGKLSKDAVENLVSLWANQDLEKSGNWLLSLPAGPMRDDGILAYSVALRRTDSAMADQWASSVTSSQ